MSRDLRFIILISFNIVVVVLLTVLLMSGPNKNDSGSSQILRDTANKLHAAGVITEAIVQYERYLDSNDIDTEVRAKIAYSLGELYEKTGSFEKALGWYYQVEISDPNSKYIDDASKKIVALLERLEKFAAAKMELNEKTSLQQKKIKKGAKVVAEIGNKKVYDYEVLEMIDLLPPNMQKEFDSYDKKVMLLQKYVAEELLYKKAVRLQYDSKPEIRKKLELLGKQIIVGEIIKEEIGDKVKADPQDVSNYFKANQERYRARKSAMVSGITLKDKKAANQIIAKLKNGEGFTKLMKENSKELIKGESVVKGKGFRNFSKDQIDKILKSKIRSWTKPILSKGKYTVFYILDKKQAGMPKYETIKYQVEQDYRMEKSKNLYQKLIQDSLKAEDVKLYVERLK